MDARGEQSPETGDSGSGRARRIAWMTDHLSPAFVFCSRNVDHASSVATAIRSLMLPKLSRAGLTSSEKTGDPSGRGGAE